MKASTESTDEDDVVPNSNRTNGNAIVGVRSGAYRLLVRKGTAFARSRSPQVLAFQCEVSDMGNSPPFGTKLYLLNLSDGLSNMAHFSLIHSIWLLRITKSEQPLASPAQ